MKLKGLVSIILIITLMVSIGCKGEENVKNENVLVYGSNDYTSINPALYEHGEINLLLFNGLTSHDKDNNIVPSLAEKWEYDKENLTYTFYLRNDVKWHDGKAFTSEDVKFTYETILNPEVGSEIVSNYIDIDEIQIIDNNTLKIVLKNENVALLDYLTVGILPKHIWEGQDITTSEFNRNPIGTGPYKFSNWDEGQSITLIKNEEYFKSDPKIDKIIFKIVDDTKARVVQLKSGELDLAQVTPKDIDTFKGNNEFVIDVMKTSDYRGIMYNFNYPLFKENRELPNALSYAVNRKEIVDNILLGYGEVAYSPLQMGKYNNPDIEKFDYNPNKTKELLEDAGWKIGNDGIYEKDGTKLSFELVFMEGDQERLDISNFLSQELKKVGVDVKVVVNANIDWKNQGAFLVGWGSPFDPDNHTYKVFTTNGGDNFNAYSNSKIDKLLTEARHIDVFEERLKYYKEFQEEMTKDMPYTFLAYIDAIYIAKSNIKGISTETILGHHGVGIFWNVEEWELE